MDMNRVLISGVVATIPETKLLASGAEVTTLTLGVRRPAKKGEDAGRVDAVPIEAWGDTGAAAARLVPGDRAIVDAVARVNAWTAQDGSPRSRLVLMAGSVVKLPAEAPVKAAVRAPVVPAAPAPADDLGMPF
jgi:single-stranded DNA-binding protein